MHDKRIITFNVCGIKNLFSFKPWNEDKNLSDTFKAMGADIVCFQETKLQQQDLRKEWAIINDYQSFFTFSSSKKGYSGVAVFIKSDIPVLAAEEGLTGWLPNLSSEKKVYRDIDSIGGYPDVSMAIGREIDDEGRTLVLDIGAAVLICLYCPANSTGDKFEYRSLFFELLDQRVKKLREIGREVIILGDINVSPALPDSAMAQQELKKGGPKFLEEEFNSSPQRQILKDWLGSGFQDTTRIAHPDREKMYTCWDLRVDGRGANFGSRIDLILASKGISCKGSDIMLEVYGSDHCPVYADLQLDIKPKEQGYTVPLLSRKRTSAFAGIQSFWSDKKKPKHAVAGVDNRQDATSKTKAVVVQQARTAAVVDDAKVRKQTPKVTTFFTKKIPKASLPDEDEDPDLAAAIKASISEQTQLEPTEINTTVIAPASSQSWKEIFTVKPPLCYHNEDSKLLKSTRKGPNKGRSFWSCHRPQGEEGNKEFRCKFFKWA